MICSSISANDDSKLSSSDIPKILVGEGSYGKVSLGGIDNNTFISISADDDSKLSSNGIPKTPMGDGSYRMVSIGRMDNNTFIPSHQDVGIKKNKEEGFHQHSARLVSI